MKRFRTSILFLLPSFLELFSCVMAHVDEHEHIHDENGTAIFAEEHDEHGSMWWKVILAVLITAVPTLLGMVIFLPLSRSRIYQEFLLGANAFAAGALLSAVFLHIYPEAMHMLEEAYEDEVELFWKSGATTLSGVLFIAILHVSFDQISHEHGHGHNPVAAAASYKAKVVDDDEMPIDEEQGRDHLAKIQIVNLKKQESTNPIRTAAHCHGQLHHDSCVIDSAAIPWWSWQPVPGMAYGLTVGDACHNFVDGLLIASAFLNCSNATGWSVTLVIVAHEVPQELGDFFVLIHAGLSVGQALFFNAISAASSLIGAIILLSMEEEISETALGLILLFGCGCFLFISLTELLPELLEQKTFGNKMIALCSFILGVGVIGVTLLGHSKCGDGHDDHGDH